MWVFSTTDWRISIFLTIHDDFVFLCPRPIGNFCNIFPVPIGEFCDQLAKIVEFFLWLFNEFCMFSYNQLMIFSLWSTDELRKFFPWPIGGFRDFFFHRLTGKFCAFNNDWMTNFVENENLECSAEKFVVMQWMSHF